MRKQIQRVADYVRSDQIAKGSLKLGSGVLVSQVLTLVSMPIVTRIYSTADYGTLAIYASIVGVAASATSLRYEVALPGVRDREEAVGLLRLIAALIVILITLTSVGAYVFRGLLIDLFGLSLQNGYILALVPVGLCFIGMYQAMNFWALRERSYSLLARTRIMQGGGRVGFHLLGWLVLPKPAALVIGEITGRAVGITRLGRGLERADFTKGWEWKTLRTIAIRYRQFPFYVFPSALLTTIMHQIMPLYLGARFSVATAGIFALCYRLLQVPIEFLNSTTGQVFFAEGSRIYATQPSSLHNLFKATALKLLWLSLVPAIVMAVAAPALFGWLFGSEWRLSGVYMSILAPLFASQSISNPLTQVAIIVKKERLGLILDISRFVLVICSVFTFSKLYSNPKSIVASYSISMTISFLISIFVMYRSSIVDVRYEA